MRRAAIDEEAQGIAGPQAVDAGEFIANGDAVRIGQPGLEVKGMAAAIADLESAERGIGKDIDAKDAEVFAGKIGRGGEFLDDRSRGANAGGMGDGGKESVIERAADFELGFAGDDIDAGLEAAGGAAIGDLDGDENGHAKATARIFSAASSQWRRMWRQTSQRKRKGNGRAWIS